MRRPLAALVFAAFAMTTTASTTPGPQRLVINQDFPDPGLLELSGTRYAYATNSGGRNIQLATAPALAGPWQQQPDAMPEANLPAWIGRDDNGRHHIWAPDVVRRDDGRFLLYYAAFHGEKRKQCMGAAVSEGPEGPFRPTGPQPLICGPEYGEVIDPAGFVDADGRRYLLYKQVLGSLPHFGPSTIEIREVASDGVTFLGPSVDLLRADRPEEANVVEAPTLVRRHDGYVLFYSANAYDSGRYFTNFATSPDLLGPYTKAPGAFLSRESLGGEVVDPGGQDLNAAADRIVFHGDLGGPGGPRGMYVAELGWDGLRPILGG